MSTYVAIDDFIGPFPVQRTERPWNGWATPYFTQDVAFDVAAAIILHHIPGLAGYDEERDAFWTVDKAYGEAAEAQSLADVPLYDGELCIEYWPRQSDGTYGIGAVAWTWDEVDIERLSEMFVDYVRDELTPAELDEVKRRNATPEYARACATHDFRDANEFMTAAFEAYFGRAANPSSQHDTDVWNAAWELARHGELTA